jgi:hypothetical protein
MRLQMWVRLSKLAGGCRRTTLLGAGRAGSMGEVDRQPTTVWMRPGVGGGCAKWPCAVYKGGGGRRASTTEMPTNRRNRR